MKLYIAGPMTGIPQFNYPAFDRAAAQIRAAGHEAVSPSELDRPEIRALALASPNGSQAEFRVQMEKAGLPIETWGDFLARDVKIVADSVDGVVLLNGWMGSKGARLEAFVGLLSNKRFYALDAMYTLDGGKVERVIELRRSMVWRGLVIGQDTFMRKNP